MEEIESTNENESISESEILLIARLQSQVIELIREMNMIKAQVRQNTADILDIAEKLE